MIRAFLVFEVQLVPRAPVDLRADLAVLVAMAKRDLKEIKAHRVRRGRQASQDTRVRQVLKVPRARKVKRAIRENANAVLAVHQVLLVNPAKMSMSLEESMARQLRARTREKLSLATELTTNIIVHIVNRWTNALTLSCYCFKNKNCLIYSQYEHCFAVQNPLTRMLRDIHHKLCGESGSLSTLNFSRFLV